MRDWTWFAASVTYALLSDAKKDANRCNFCIDICAKFVSDGVLIPVRLIRGVEVCLILRIAEDCGEDC